MRVKEIITNQLFLIVIQILTPHRNTGHVCIGNEIDKKGSCLIQVFTHELIHECLYSIILND